jgi:hypothetical protein
MSSEITDENKRINSKYAEFCKVVYFILEIFIRSWKHYVHAFRQI